MTEVAAESTQTSTEGAPGVPEQTPDGRYIPYGGGILGWFENSGVLKKELPNNYKFSSVLDAALVRKKQFDRWGEIQNRREEERVRVIPEVKVTLLVDRDKREAATKDLSGHGMRLQLTEEIAAKKGDTIRVQVHNPKKKNASLEIEANVMWLEKAGKLRSVWNMGLGFPALNADQSKTLQAILLQRN